MSALRRTGRTADWNDQRIAPGGVWEQEIYYNLNNAGVILLLISSDFIASDFCFTVEMKRALERQAAGEARVIPIICRPCDWSSLPIAKLQALPKNGVPITTWPNRDEAFTDVVQGIRAVVDDLSINVSSLDQTHSNLPAEKESSPPLGRPAEYWGQYGSPDWRAEEGVLGFIKTVFGMRW